MVGWALLCLVVSVVVVVIDGQGLAPDAVGAESVRPDEPGQSQLVFSDVAAEVGLDFVHGSFRWGISADPESMMGGGLCWIDYDSDGWLDLFVVNDYSPAEWSKWQEAGGLPTTHLYRNEKGRFIDVTTAGGVGLAIRGQGCVAADFDGDGRTDLYVTSTRFNALLWNDGNGQFTEGARAASVDGYGWHTGAAAGDVNGDGLVDLFVSGYVDLNRPIESPASGFPNTHLGVRDLLYINNGDRSFAEVGADLGLDRADEYGLGAVLVDVDQDGDLDLYVANDTNPNRLYLNRPASGYPGFSLSEEAERMGVADPNSGMGVAAGDFDAASGVDFFITNFGNQGHSLYQASGGDFLDSRDDFGPAGVGVGLVGWGSSWGDFDLDTDLDLLIVHGNVPVQDLASDRQPIKLLENLLVGRGVEWFVDVSGRVGLETVGPRLGRGSAAADFDNDGDLDVAVNSIGSPLTLLRNDGAAGHWLGISLAGSLPGSMVKVVLGDGTELTRSTIAGSSYLSSEDPRLLFGLGANRVVEVQIWRPDGTSEILTDVVVDTFIFLR